MGLDPLPSVHMRPPEPDPLRGLTPLRVDVINGWPLIGNLQPGMRSMTKKRSSQILADEEEKFFIDFL